MPLKHDSSDESFHYNVAELIRSGHPADQAVAIAHKIRGDSTGDSRIEPKHPHDRLKGAMK